MKTIKVAFENGEGHELAARLELPVDQQPYAYAMFAHCFTCSKDLGAVRNISRALTANGIAVLRFDFTGLGESGGEFADTNFSSNVEDLVAAADFLAENYEPVRIMIGHSLGGSATLLAATQIASVKAVVTIGSPAEPEHVTHLFGSKLDEISATGSAEVNIGGRPFFVKKQLLDDLQAVSLRERLKSLKKPLLVMHSPIDTIVGVDNARRIYEAALHPKSFISLDDADHLLSNKADSEYAGQMIAAWVSRYVEQPAPPSLQAPKQVAVRTGIDGFLTEVKAGNHHFLADEPVKVGGTDLGPTPYDLLVAALGTCTSMTISMYARHKGLDLKNVTVHLQHSKVHAEDSAGGGKEDGSASNAKIDQIEREIVLEGNLTDQQRERILQIADRCPVHRTLHGDIKVVSRLSEE